MKRVKNTVILFSIIAGWVLIFFVLPKILENKTLYLFGNFIPRAIFVVLWWLPVLVAEIIMHIKFFKEYTIFKKIFYTLLSCGIVVYMVYIVADEANRFSAKEEINLSDDNKIILYEEDFMQYDRTSETAITVYEVKGIIAKEIGYCWESLYCDEYCLKENKWDYTYDETDKKLTLILKYDKTKDENGVGTRSKEFILE